jgi:hypothetical protein
MLIKEVTYPNTATDAVVLAPPSGQRLEVYRIIGSNKTGADMTISRGAESATTRLINLEESKGFMLEWADEKPLSLDEDEDIQFNGGIASTNTIITVHYRVKG